MLTLVLCFAISCLSSYCLTKFYILFVQFYLSGARKLLFVSLFVCVEFVFYFGTKLYCSFCFTDFVALGWFDMSLCQDV